jgi:hypothetical protein
MNATCFTLPDNVAPRTRTFVARMSAKRPSRSPREDFAAPGSGMSALGGKQTLDRLETRPIRGFQKAGYNLFDDAAALLIERT